MREQLSWRQFTGTTFEPVVVYMWGQENFYFCSQLQQLKLCFLEVIIEDLSFGAELAMSMHGKVSKCFSIKQFM